MSISSPPSSHSTPGHEQQASPVATVTSGMTLRAVLIGIVLTILLNIWAIHSAYVAGSSHISSTHLPIAALFPFLMVVLFLNPALKKLAPGHALNRYELIIIFFLVFTASAIPAWAFSSYWITAITGPYYYASPENQWVNTFFHLLPSWLIVPDHGQAVQWFFEGIPDNQTLSLQTWIATWMTPLLWWICFYIAIFAVGASAMVMLRKQWVEHERLTFPLAQVPLLLVEDADDNRLWPPITRTPVFWYGFGITFFILAWNMVSYFGVVPEIPIGMRSGNFKIAASFPAIPLKFNFLVAAIAFFTNINVLSSICVFYLIMVFQEGIMIDIGVPNAYHVMRSQHAGGFLMFALFSIWMARRHLKDVFLKALGKAPHVDDSREFFSYRIAVFGMLLGLIYIFCWLHTAGMSPGVIAVLMGSLLLMFVGVTRMVAETGLVFLDLPFEANDFTVQVIGSGELSSQNLTALSFSNTFARNWRTLGMCSMGHIAKVDDEVGGTGKGAFGAIAFVLVLSAMTAVLYTMYLGYGHNGAANFIEGAFVSGSKLPYNNLVKWINNREALTGTELGFLGIGGIFSSLLIYAYHRFAWWSLHPIGFVVVKTAGMGSMITAIFVVWLIKALLLRFGGIQLYRKAIPAVIGMLVAFVFGVFLSYIVDLIWFPQNGHMLQNW